MVTFPLNTCFCQTILQRLHTIRSLSATLPSKNYLFDLFLGSLRFSKFSRPAATACSIVISYTSFVILEELSKVPENFDID